MVSAKWGLLIFSDSFYRHFLIVQFFNFFENSYLVILNFSRLLPAFSSLPNVETLDLVTLHQLYGCVKRLCWGLQASVFLWRWVTTYLMCRALQLQALQAEKLMWTFFSIPIFSMLSKLHLFHLLTTLRRLNYRNIKVSVAAILYPSTCQWASLSHLALFKTIIARLNLCFVLCLRKNGYDPCKRLWTFQERSSDGVWRTKKPPPTSRLLTFL